MCSTQRLSGRRHDTRVLSVRPSVRPSDKANDIMHDKNRSRTRVQSNVFCIPWHPNYTIGVFISLRLLCMYIDLASRTEVALDTVRVHQWHTVHCIKKFIGALTHCSSQDIYDQSKQLCRVTESSILWNRLLLGRLATILSGGILLATRLGTSNQPSLIRR